jgi:hypothetical protein
VLSYATSQNFNVIQRQEEPVMKNFAGFGVSIAAAVVASSFLASAALAADNTIVSVKNNWEKTIRVYVYNGKDTTRWSTAAQFYVEPGKTDSRYCAGQGKGRCYVKIFKLRGNKIAEVKWGGWVKNAEICTVPKSASGARWDEVTCR